jgi:hypothetical protein
MSNQLEMYFDDVTNNYFDGKKFSCHFSIINISGLHYVFFITGGMLSLSHRNFQKCYSLNWYTIRTAFLEFKKDYDLEMLEERKTN